MQTIRSQLSDSYCNMDDNMVAASHDASLLSNKSYNKRILEESNTQRFVEESCVPRPARWCPTAEQIQLLDAVFNSGTTTPSREMIVEIAACLKPYGNIAEANVFYWFQNRKARAKRKFQTKPTAGDDSIRAAKEGRNCSGSRRVSAKTNSTSVPRSDLCRDKMQEIISKASQNDHLIHTWPLYNNASLQQQIHPLSCDDREKFLPILTSHDPPFSNLQKFPSMQTQHLPSGNIKPILSVEETVDNPAQKLLPNKPGLDVLVAKPCENNSVSYARESLEGTRKHPLPIGRSVDIETDCYSRLNLSAGQNFLENAGQHESTINLRRVDVMQTIANQSMTAILSTSMESDQNKVITTVPSSYTILHDSDSLVASLSKNITEYDLPLWELLALHGI